MDISSQSIRDTDFTIVKKGYDPDEVDAFKQSVAEAVESAQAHATQMESRARAAVARLQEATNQVAALRDGTPSGGIVHPNADDAEVISRTLLLAQRTADQTVTDARSQAEQITASARDEASSVLENARSTAGKLLEEAKVEARRSKEDEIARAENEVQALLARRDFLLGDVEQLEQYIQAQRERLREAASTLTDLAERVPGGLGDLRRPVLSASAEPVSRDDETRQVPTTAAAPAAEAPAPVAQAAPVAPAAPVTAPTPVVDNEPEPLVVRALDVEDDDPMSLFTAAPSANSGTPSGGIVFDFAEDDDWDDFSDDNAASASTTVVPQVFDAVTAEVPIISSNAPTTVQDVFRIGGDEMR